MKKEKKQRRNRDRASLIINLFREFPNNRFSLKHLAAASGGADRDGRRETLLFLDRLYDEGVIEECARRHLCRVVDLYRSVKQFETVDGFHPNAAGMKTIADAVLGELEEEVQE